MDASARKLIINICRIILGAVFVFSGGMKCLDTWGTAQKVGEYITAFGMDWLLGAKVVIGVLLSAFELTLGLMLIAGIRKRAVSLVAFIFMAGFTLLTLYIAIWDPLDECGCFGEAVRISNWNSFYKNLVLLALSAVVWYSCRRGKFFPFTGRETVLTAIFFVFSLFVGTVVYRHLPPVDLFPYKKGVNLGTDVLCTACIDQTVTLVYRDLQTGGERKFSLDDTEWYDTERWEYVRTESAYDLVTAEMLDEDFAVYDGDLNVADSIVFYEGATAVVIVRDPYRLPDKAFGRLENYISAHEDRRIIVITEKSDRFFRRPAVTIGGREYETYGMESRPLGYLLRADAGVVELRDGVVGKKRNWRDL